MQPLRLNAALGLPVVVGALEKFASFLQIHPHQKPPAAPAQPARRRRKYEAAAGSKLPRVRARKEHDGAPADDPARGGYPVYGSRTTGVTCNKGNSFSQPESGLRAIAPGRCRSARNRQLFRDSTKKQIPFQSPRYSARGVKLAVAARAGQKVFFCAGASAGRFG